MERQLNPLNPYDTAAATVSQATYMDSQVKNDFSLQDNVETVNGFSNQKRALISPLSNHKTLLGSNKKERKALGLSDLNGLLRVYFLASSP